VPRPITVNEADATLRRTKLVAESSAGAFLGSSSLWFWDAWLSKNGAAHTRLMSSDPIRGSTVPTATAAPVAPAATLAGDLVIVVTWTVGTAGVPTHTIQSGYTEIRTQAHDDGSTDGRLSIAYHNPTGGNNGTSLAGAQAHQAYATSGGTDYSGILVLKKGFWSVTGIQSNSTNDTFSSPPTAPAVTLNQKKIVLAIGAWHLSAAATVAVTPPTNYTEVWEIAGSVAAELSMAYRIFKTAVGTAETPGAFADDVTPNGSAVATIAITMTPATQTREDGNTGIVYIDETNVTGDLYFQHTTGDVDTVGDIKMRFTNTGSVSDALPRNILVEIKAASTSAPSAADIADAVWDEVLAGHLTAGTTGKALSDILAAGGGDCPTVEEIDAYLTGQHGSGSWGGNHGGGFVP